jgi:cytidyltransferase-like protein
MARGSGIGRRVVFTDGVFDLLHANHVAFLEEAKSFGDWLVVGVVSDLRTEDYKRRPILSQEERLRVVKALSCVDEAFIIHDALTSETMERIIADHNVTAVVYAGDSTPEFYVAAERSGIMHRLPYRAGVNSSEIIKRIVSRNDL